VRSFSRGGAHGPPVCGWGGWPASHTPVQAGMHAGSGDESPRHCGVASTASKGRLNTFHVKSIRTSSNKAGIQSAGEYDERLLFSLAPSHPRIELQTKSRFAHRHTATLYKMPTAMDHVMKSKVRRFGAQNAREWI